MTERSSEPGKLSRRRFGAIAVGGAGALLVGSRFVLQDDDDATAVRTFDVEHDSSVYVTMTNGTEFIVEVKQTGTGEVLERHEGVTARTLLSLQSEHLAIIDRS